MSVPAPAARPGKGRTRAAARSSTLAPIPVDDNERLIALRSYGVLDSDPEPEFDELAGLAAAICETPQAFVSFVDRDREFFKAAVGSDLGEAPRDTSFCGHAIVTDGPMVVPDTLADPRFAENPQVLGDPHVRFYAGVPLVTPDGFAIGTLCVKDTKPRELSEGQLAALATLSRQVTNQLELRRLRVEHRAEAASERQLAGRLHTVASRHELLLENVNAGVITVDLAGEITRANPTACRELGYSEQELLGRPAHELLQHSDADGTRSSRSAGFFGPGSVTPVPAAKSPAVLWRKDGSYFEVEHTTIPVAEDEQPGGVVVLFRNVSRERVAERRLLETLETMSDGFLALDHELRYTYVNAAAEGRFGPRSTLLGRRMADIAQDEEKPFLLACGRALRQQTPIELSGSFGAAGG